MAQCKSQSVGQWFIVSDLEIHSYRLSCVFVFLTVQNIIFYVLGPLAFQKYSTCWVFPALHHSVFVYLCLCICVFVHFSVKNIIFAVLGSLAFQKYKYVGYFRHFLTCCIFVFAYLYLCICVFDSPEYHF